MQISWTEGVKVRQHNGQCPYGPWMSVDDDEVPRWVEAIVADEIVELQLDEGTVSQGGSIWMWKKAD
jgi:hypothetical protein